MKVVVAWCDRTSLVGEFLVADAALGRHDRHEAIALRVRLARGRPRDPAALARLTGGRELCALGLGRRRVGPALFGPDVHHTHRLFIATFARAPVSVPHDHLALVTRRNVPGCKKVDREHPVKDLLEHRPQVPGNVASDALKLTENVESASGIAVLHCFCYKV